MPECWIFGASKTVGLALLKALGSSHTLVSFSRSDLPPGFNHQQHKVDFQDRQGTDALIQARLKQSTPDSIIFCQRFRADKNEDELSAVTSGLNVELGPVLSCIEQLNKAGSQKPISVVLISSVAGLLTHLDLPFHYHLLKSATLTATQVLANTGAASNIRVNCIVLGEFEKFPRASYDEKSQLKFSAVEQFSPGNQLCTTDGLVDVISFLISPQSTFVTGQAIRLDGGLSNVSQESIVRTMLR